MASFMQSEKDDIRGQSVPYDLQQYQAGGNTSGNSSISNSTLMPTAPEFIPHRVAKEQSFVRRQNTGAIPKQFNRYEKRNGYKKRNWNQRNNDSERRQHQNEHNTKSKFYEQNENFNENTPHEKRNFKTYNKDTPKSTEREKFFSRRKFSKRKPTENEHSEYSQRDKLIKEIENNILECLVCCELIRDYHTIWSCRTCYHIFHLKCIKQWVNSSRSDDETWRCPACQNPETIIPKDYLCFCGKVRNPTPDKNDIAHSCGSVCGAKCPENHMCTLLCHPGPHLECKAFVERHCYCKKVSKVVMCSQREEFSCPDICDKLLPCKKHRCTLVCHTGECLELCPKEVITCFCLKTTKTVECNIENTSLSAFSCNKVCDKLFKCGKHACTDKCHEGPCNGDQECPFRPETLTTCPCQRISVLPSERQVCTDPIPLCKSICKKQLSCGTDTDPHFCNAKCHTGQCPPCQKKRKLKCRCGSANLEMKCKDITAVNGDVRCKKKCQKTKNCFRHKCNELCCIDISHICHSTCNKLLSCKKHRCQEFCHAGNCRPCSKVSFEELACYCGASVLYPPINCAMPPPYCSEPCSRQHTCDHPVLHNCHIEPACPPCVVLTTKWCYGLHEQRKTIPCYEESFSCGKPCGKILPTNCGHKCQRICHLGTCMNEGDKCTQKCTKPRLDCNHICAALCHEGHDCPDQPCKENVEVQCECGNLKRTRTCYDYSNEYRRIANAQLASTMQEVQNGTKISLKDVLGCTKKTNKTLECNNECKTIERNRRLELAFGPRDPAKQQLPPYSEFLKNYAKKDLNLIKGIHSKLTDLVKLAKESKQKSRSHSFPIMNREKRQVVHEMCEVFGIQSQSYDSEPNRNVVATAYKDTCFCPTMSLMEIVQRDSGQRIRLPMSQNLRKWTTTTPASTKENLSYKRL